MAEIVNLIKNVGDIEVSPEFDAYTEVVVNIDDDNYATAGENEDGNGKTLEVTNPLFGSQEVAEKMLERLQAAFFRYQPHQMQGAILDPASEVGDAVSANGVFGGIYNRERTFGRLMKANISAPSEEEINHEYQFETPEERKVKRQFGDVRASILVEAGRITSEITDRTNADEALGSRITQNATDIEARVAKTGGTEGSSNFWWKLTATDWKVGSGSKEIFAVYKNTSSNQYEAKVEGRIVANSGSIGGFTIGSTALYTNNMNNMDPTVATQTNGVYVGNNGIRLGKNFYVTNAGNVTANNMTLTGTLTVGSGTISADTLRGGAAAAAGGAARWNDTESKMNKGKNNWDTAYSRVTTAYVGNYQLNFGTGITIRGNAFTDSMGGTCSGSTTRSNVVTSSYKS